jgi:hypothetical protein
VFLANVPGKVAPEKLDGQGAEISVFANAVAVAARSLTAKAPRSTCSPTPMPWPPSTRPRPGSSTANGQGAEIKVFHHGRIDLAVNLAVNLAVERSRPVLIIESGVDRSET